MRRTFFIVMEDLKIFAQVRLKRHKREKAQNDRLTGEDMEFAPRIDGKSVIADEEREGIPKRSSEAH